MAHSHTTPSSSASFMYSYAGCPRCTGAIPWLRASAQEMRPFPLSSYISSALLTSSSFGAGVAVESGGGSCTIISVDVQPDKMLSSASRFSLIDGETVPLAYLHCATCEPAAIHVGKPFRYVLTALLKAIDRRTGQGEVEKVRGKLSPSFNKHPLRKGGWVEVPGCFVAFAPYRIASDLTRHQCGSLSI